jgi:excisionase family DNA binding protein
MSRRTVASSLVGIIINGMSVECVQGPDGDQGSSALPQVLTVEDVDDLMRVDRKTAYAAIADGRVPGVRRIGRCIRVSRDVLLRWLEQGEAKQGRGRHP